MSLQALTLENPQLAASQPHQLKLVFTVTAGVVTQIATKNRLPIIFGTADSAFTQAAVNALLGVDSATSTEEIDTTVAFGSTALGVDAFGFVLACSGQIADVVGMEAVLYDAEDMKFVPKVTSLPDTLTAGLLVTPAGNLAGRVIPTGLDSETGQLVITIHFFSK
jgi:hypothetical protein